MFQERFNMIMDMAKMTNVRLSKILNIDASLISRYRSGTRSPLSNSQILRISELELDEASFTEWLFQTDEAYSDDSYYCIHDTHTVFSHTLFVCSDTAVIEACNVNDRIRFHPKINNYYEKYDKSQDTYLICPACLAKNSPEKDRCVYCHVPLLK